MAISAISDLAQSLYLRRDNALLRERLFEATRELSTGQHSNIVSHLSGDLGPLADIERSLKNSESFLIAVGEQRLRTNSAQDALETIRNTASSIAGALLLVQDTSDPGLVKNSGTDALARFDAIVSALNIDVGGVSLFSGIATDQPPLASAETILDQIVAEIAAAGADTADTVGAVVDAWFETGGNFETVGYVGGDRPTNGTRVGESTIVQPLATAEAPEIREMLSAVALAALVGRDVLDAEPDEQATLARNSGLRMLTADEAIVRLQAEIGTQQYRISIAESENRARISTLELHRSELVGIDPFEAATRLQETETQLESLYAMTARISRLSLAEFLR